MSATRCACGHSPITHGRQATTVAPGCQGGRYRCRWCPCEGYREPEPAT